MNYLLSFQRGQWACEVPVATKLLAQIISFLASSTTSWLDGLLAPSRALPRLPPQAHRRPLLILAADARHVVPRSRPSGRSRRRGGGAPAEEAAGAAVRCDGHRRPRPLLPPHPRLLPVPYTPIPYPSAWLIVIRVILWSMYALPFRCSTKLLLGSWCWCATQRRVNWACACSKMLWWWTVGIWWPRLCFGFWLVLIYWDFTEGLQKDSLVNN